jgi:hypothetical protein
MKAAAAILGALMPPAERSRAGHGPWRSRLLVSAQCRRYLEPALDCGRYLAGDSSRWVVMAGLGLRSGHLAWLRGR